MSPRPRIRPLKTNRLTKGYSVTAIVLNQERPTVVRKAERNKDYGTVHLDVGADQMDSWLIAWPP
jgi:hypothetical protein